MAAIDIPERYNASLLLDDAVAGGRGDSTAIHARGTRLTYAELLEHVSRAGAALRELGARAGDRIVLAMDDCPEFVALFLGAMRVGAVPVPVNPFSRGDDFTHFVADSGARVVAFDSLRAATVLAASTRLDRHRLLCVDGDADGSTTLAEITAAQERRLGSVDSRRNDVAFWLYSSGSTGRPKAVVHRHGDILFTCRTYAREILGITADDVTFSTTKLFHAYGLGNNLSFPYSTGAATVLLGGRPTPEAVFETVRAFRPTLFFSVPTLYNNMLAAAEARADDFEGVRLCISAAEPLPAPVWHRWHERYGLAILDGVGSTEMLHIYCSNRGGDVAPGSSGRPVTGYELRLLDESGAQLDGAAAAGELEVRGGSTFVEYWNQPERTTDAFHDGWFRTRDRYRRDEAGCYWYEGRADDMFKVSGLWVSPAEVEARLIEHPGVLEAAVVGVAVDGFVRPKAYVTVRAGGTEPPEPELRAFCAEKLHRHEVPKLYEFVDELPKTPTGKIERYKLRS